jgi:hypothetical protein
LLTFISGPSDVLARSGSMCEGYRVPVMKESLSVTEHVAHVPGIE